MTVEGLSVIYSPEFGALDPEAVDSYLTDIPRTETFNAPAETVKAPGTVSERIARVTEAIRKIEVARHSISWHASVLRDALEIDPDVISALPEDEQLKVRELISRLMTTE